MQAKIPLPERLGIKPREARRAKYGSWKAPAEIVARLVANGWGVSESVRKVAEDMNDLSKNAVVGIRGAYYLSLKQNQKPQ